MSEDCENCDKSARLWLDDGCGFCCECAIEFCQDEIKKDEREEEFGFDELDVTELMTKKTISYNQAVEELKKQGGKKE